MPAQGLLSELFGPAVLHLCGYASGLLVLAGLSYPVKRWFPRLPGSAASWLRLHRYSSSVAFGLALVHTDLYFTGWALLTLSLLGAQAATGLAGSWIMASLPRTEEGAEKVIERMRDDLEERRAAGAGEAEVTEKKARLARAERAWRLLVRWREVHVPLGVAVIAAGALHALSTYYY